MAQDRMQRRHVREKAVIDHLAEKVFDTSPSPEVRKKQPTTETGQSVERQVRKKWDPRKGGLPTFCAGQQGNLRSG